MDKKKIILLNVFALIVFILILSIFIFRRIAANSKIPELQYVMETVPVLPKEPGIPDEYLYSRNPAPSWTFDEADKWFTYPIGENLNQLDAANDQLVRKILEAAP